MAVLSEVGEEDFVIASIEILQVIVITGIVLLGTTISVTFCEVVEIVSDLKLVVGIIAFYDLIRVPMRECKDAGRECSNNKNSSGGADHFKADIDGRWNLVEADE